MKFWISAIVYSLEQAIEAIEQASVNYLESSKSEHFTSPVNNTVKLELN